MGGKLGQGVAALKREPLTNYDYVFQCPGNVLKAIIVEIQKNNALCHTCIEFPRMQDFPIIQSTIQEIISDVITGTETILNFKFC